MSDWISVEDYMPKLGVNVLVYLGEPDIDIEIDYLEIECEHGTEFFANLEGAVTHWMPLPEPSK